MINLLFEAEKIAKSIGDNKDRNEVISTGLFLPLVTSLLGIAKVVPWDVPKPFSVNFWKRILSTNTISCPSFETIIITFWKGLSTEFIVIIETALKRIKTEIQGEKKKFPLLGKLTLFFIKAYIDFIKGIETKVFSMDDFSRIKTLSDSFSSPELEPFSVPLQLATISDYIHILIGTFLLGMNNVELKSYLRFVLLQSSFPPSYAFFHSSEKMSLSTFISYGNHLKQQPPSKSCLLIILKFSFQIIFSG